MQEDKQVTVETIRPKSWPNKIEVHLQFLKHILNYNFCIFVSKNIFLIYNYFKLIFVSYMPLYTIYPILNSLIEYLKN